jgi:triacylglycerol lipase
LFPAEIAAMMLREDAPLDDPGVATTLAAACQLAYLPAEAGTAAFQNDFGLTAKLISVSNTQAYLAVNDDAIVIAFRGSEGPTSLDGIKDWLLTNALNLLILPEGDLSTEFVAAGVGARFHQGFVSAITDIWPALFPEVEREFTSKDRPVWITGHSLGGALALLAAWLLKRKFVPVHRVITFGAPMVGNPIVAESLNREFGGRILRYVNAPDPVPLLPMMSLVANDYSHCETIRLLGDAAAPESAISFVKEMAVTAAGAAFSGSIVENFWNVLKGRIAAHLMTDYRKRL